MPSKNSTISTQQPIALRRSPRFRHHQNLQEFQHLKTPQISSIVTWGKDPLRSVSFSPVSTFSVKQIPKDKTEEDRENPKEPSVGSRGQKSISGLRKSRRFNKEIEGLFCLRRSPRFSNRGKCEEVDKSVQSEQEASLDVKKAKMCGYNSRQEHVEKTPRVTRSSAAGKDNANEISERGVLLSERKDKVCADMGEEFLGKKEKRTKNFAGLKTMVIPEVRTEVRGVDVLKEEDGSNRKRKRKQGDKGNEGSQEWTMEEELALQRAYFAAKPTPQFWKKVAKLVPGKTAKDCFDKVQSDYLTPSQPRTRSRMKNTKSPPSDHFSLSASKLLNPTGRESKKKPSCNKMKSQLTQKTVRRLLQKHCRVDKDYETDLFSVLEPAMDLAASSPNPLERKMGFVQICTERPSSATKKPVSRFGNSCTTCLSSPPVLKQVKNRALHERYIDQLHVREAKRKEASRRAAKAERKEERVQKLDVVRAAKDALVSDARDVINQFRHMQADAASNCSDFDGGDDEDDAFGEDEM